MILSVSRRTDIPAHFPLWFRNRLEAGSVLVPNPVNRRTLYRIPLSPRTVDCIVFWTKDPRPLMEHLPAIEAMGYRYCFQLTLTPYGTNLEPGLPDKEGILEAVRELGKRLGRDAISWRYDPILLTPACTPEWHKEAFARLCARLAPYTNSVTVSFLNHYRKTRSLAASAPTPDQQLELGESLGQTAAAHGLPIRTCCEAGDFSAFGIAKGGCLDREHLSRVCGYPLGAVRDKNQRQGCVCVESVDVGVYHTCLFRCKYCYAGHMPPGGVHDPAGELLVGRPGPENQIIPRQVRSLREDQVSFY